MIIPSGFESTDYTSDSEPTLRVSSLHAWAYCPRLFYLEEVEGLYTQDAAVFAGRRLHVELEQQEGEDWEELFLSDEDLGLRGCVDALRTRDGQIIPYEHKRGRAARNANQQPEPWPSDRLQVLAYACLLEATAGKPITECRIRYHADNVTVKVPVDSEGRQFVQVAIAEAKQLRRSPYRPPVTANERLCARCSLAPVCLPEEARLANNREWDAVRLFPQDDDREVIHVLEPGSRVGRTGEQIRIERRDQASQVIPIRQVAQLALHSFSQISTQALYLCKDHDVGVHWISGGGRYQGSFDRREGSIQRRIGQFRALSDPNQCLRLAQQLVLCRGQSQRKFLMRGQRRQAEATAILKPLCQQIKVLLQQIHQAENLQTLLGLEGNIAALYFQGLPSLLNSNTAEELKFCGRNRRPPQDAFNALLGFGYALLLKDVVNSIVTVGLEPALGFYHQPRSQAYPLGLDLMEIFRVPLVDMVIVASINRSQWDFKRDFEQRGTQVWLSDCGRRQFINLYEQRKQEVWKHPVTRYSLSYRRLMELEVRLLEKEWLGEGGLFAQLVVR